MRNSAAFAQSPVVAYTMGFTQDKHSILERTALVAVLYYRQRMTQKQISKLLGICVFTVIRDLARSRAVG